MSTTTALAPLATAPPVYGAEVAVELASATKLYVAEGSSEVDAAALLTTVLNVEPQPDMAEFCSDSTEFTPEAMVALGGMPVMIPFEFVMVV